MSRFIFKTFLFVSPLVILYFINYAFYHKEYGDLLKIGFIYSASCNMCEVRAKDETSPRAFTLLSEVDLGEKQSFEVMTIGDSFSEMAEYGYQNNLATAGGRSLIHIDRHLAKNPIETLWGLTNGDFFDSLAVDYVILQSVERDFVARSEAAETGFIYNLSTIRVEIKNYKEPENIDTDRFFSDAVLKIPLTNMLYKFDSKPLSSKTYMVETTDSLFANCPPKLLFYENDVAKVGLNNDIQKVANANTILNALSAALSKRGIRLMVLINPDKYDLYYPYIADKDGFPEPLFFDHLQKMEKHYLYIDGKEVLKEKIKTRKDIYYYGGSHSSMEANGFIGEAVEVQLRMGN